MHLAETSLKGVRRGLEDRGPHGVHEQSRSRASEVEAPNAVCNLYSDVL